MVRDIRKVAKVITAHFQNKHTNGATVLLGKDLHNNRVQSGRHQCEIRVNVKE